MRSVWGVFAEATCYTKFGFFTRSFDVCAPAPRESIVPAHLGSHQLLVARSAEQADSMEQSLADTRTSSTTLDSLNLGIAEDLLWNQGEMEAMPAEKAETVVQRDAQLRSCDTHSMATLNQFGDIQKWQKVVEEHHKMPPVFHFLGNWAPV